MTRAEAVVRATLGDAVVGVVVIYFPRFGLLVRVRAGYTPLHGALDYLAEELGCAVTAHVEPDGVRWLAFNHLAEAGLAPAGADPWPYPENLESFTQMTLTGVPVAVG